MKEETQASQDLWDSTVVMLFWWCICSTLVCVGVMKLMLLNNQFQTTIERVDLVAEIYKEGDTNNKIYVTTERGVFSVKYDGNQYLLLLEPEDHVTISYYKKASEGPTEAAYIRVDDSSNPNIVIEKGG